jgi:DNA polymerase
MQTETELNTLITNWSNCKRCSLHQTRRKVVVGAGSFSPHVLFVGEGPGKSEDLLGEPFVGPSGRVLAAAIRDAMKMVELSREFRFFKSNVVACRPTDKRNGKNRPPTKEESWSCMPRLIRLEEILGPALVVMLGEVPMKLAGSHFPGCVKLSHPSHILRSGGEASGVYPGYVRDMAAHISTAYAASMERSGG